MFRNVLTNSTFHYGADIFKESPTYLEDEAAYEKVKKELLGEVSPRRSRPEQVDFQQGLVVLKSWRWRT